MFGLKKLLRQLLRQLESLENNQANLGKASSHTLEELSAGLKDLRDSANRHDMAIEDLLDDWEDLQEKQQKESRALAAALSASFERENHSLLEREESLLKLLMAYHDQLYALQRAADEAGADAWIRQFTLADNRLSEDCYPAGVQIVCSTGVPVNYAIHEVVDTVAAAVPAQDYLVADVCSCGYLYMGKVIRKAEVSVYRLPEDLPAAPYSDIENREALS